jgi:hypothetical protein
MYQPLELRANREPTYEFLGHYFYSDKNLYLIIIPSLHLHPGSCWVQTGGASLTLLQIADFDVVIDQLLKADPAGEVVIVNDSGEKQQDIWREQLLQRFAGSMDFMAR